MLRKIIVIDEERCNGCGLCANACHEGGKGADDGNEPAEEDGFVSVFFVKFLCFFHMLRFDKAVVAGQQFGSELFPYPVVAGVP